MKGVKRNIMSSSATVSGGPARNPVLTAVADRRRRHVVRLLVDARSPLSVEDLAIHLATMDGEKPLSEVTEREFRSRRTDLTQILLPRLEDAGLLTWDQEDGTVTTTGHPAFDDPKFERIVEPETGNWDAVLANLAHERRRVALSELKAESVPMTVTDLARTMAAHETNTEAERDRDAVESLCTSLHHVHLPKLAEAGLVEYDPSSGAISYAGHPDLDDSWFDFCIRDAPGPIVAAAE